MDNFFVIKLINHRTSDRGFVSSSVEKGVMISDTFFHAKQFGTKKEAQVYVKQNRLERNGYTAHFWSNQELIIDGGMGKRMTKTLYTAINLKGEHVFYDADKGYYFEDRDAGYCSWETDQEVKDFIVKMNFDFDVIVSKIEPKVD